ncbi:LysR family transcriptional regulator [Burkholderiaceae bacterium UC74_6]
MSQIDRIRIFQRVAELGSFTQAADSLSLPKARASTAVQQLEAELGARLFHRTTRRVQLTQDGQAFFERSRDVLDDLEELQSMFQLGPGASLSGRVRVDMSTGLARRIVIPRLPELLKKHPGLAFEVSSTERRVDLVREGFDCVVRAGTVGDSSLIARPLGELVLVNCASPAYVRKHGKPRKLEDLVDPDRGHRLVHFAGTLGSRAPGFEHAEGEIDMPGSITVNNADAYEAACLAGLGIVQAPLLAMRPWIESGGLVELLPAHRAPPMPVNIVYANRRHLSQRLRVVMDWLAKLVGDELARQER